jgi:hypothetical protein
VDQVVLDSFHQGCGGGVGDSEEFLHIFPVNCFRVAPPPPVEELVKVGGGVCQSLSPHLWDSRWGT